MSMRRPWSAAVLMLTTASCAKGIPVPEPTSTITVPAGLYTIGQSTFSDTCQQAACDATAGSRPVRLTHSFGIEQHEVTIRQYAACTELEHCCWDNNTDTDYQEHGDLPVRVTIGEARQYCAWRGRRLATEAEWEVAARVKRDGTLQTYPWGDSPKSCAEVSSSECGGATLLRPVGTNDIDKTPLGIQDMGGNAAEWVDDDFTAYVACRFQLPLSAVCNNDGNCQTALCSAMQCQASCQSGSQSLPCTGNSANGPLCAIPVAPVQDPYYIRYPHQVQTGQDSLCGSSNNSGQDWPVAKGGGVDAARCQQAPARRTVAYDYPGGSTGSGSNNDNRARHAFRCVEDPEGSSAPKPAVASSFLLQQPPRCGVLTVSAKAPAPQGWGTRAKVALLSSAGFEMATYNASKALYEIDRTAQPGCSGSTVVYNPRLVLDNLEFARYDLTVSYPSDGYNGGQPCTTAVATVTVDLGSGQQSCSEFGNLNPIFTCM